MQRVKIHGGVSFLGKDSELQNLTLDVEPVDPQGQSEGGVWFNSILKRFSYLEEEPIGDQPGIVKRLATLDDLQTIVEADANRVKVNNATDTDLMFGQPVYQIDQSNAGLACANSAETRNVLGLVSDTVIPMHTGTGNVQTNGALTGTIAQWEAVTGIAGGLTPNKDYFLDIITGWLTTSPSFADGNHLCFVGTALSTTEFLIKIQRPIAL